MLTHMLICLSISVFEYRVALEVVGTLYATPRILNLQFHLLPPSPVESDSHRGYACGVATATPARETNFKRIFENKSRLYPSRDILSPAYSEDYSPSRVPRGLVLFLTFGGLIPKNKVGGGAIQNRYSTGIQNSQELGTGG